MRNRTKLADSASCKIKMAGVPGGLSVVKEADAEVEQIAEKVRASAEQQVGKCFGEYKAVSYRSQVVAGTNYYIKVKVGDKEYVHLKVYQTLPHAGREVSLSSLQDGKTLDDPIEFF